MKKAELEIVRLNNDVVTTSGGFCCDTIGRTGQDHAEDDC